MHAVAGEGVEENRQRSHQCLTLAGSHLGNLALVQHRAAYELHVVVHHVPSHLVAAGHPVVVIDGFVAVDLHKVLALGCQGAVHVGGCDCDALVACKSPCGFFHNREHHRECLVEFLLKHFEDFLLYFINFFPVCFALVVVDSLNFLFNRIDFVALVLHGFLKLAADAGCALTQLVVAQALNLGIDGLDLVNYGEQFLEVAIRFCAEEFLQNVIKSHIVLFLYFFYVTWP